MARAIRRALPDNLDPLVDTLANVVGILVIVIALTQLELGDALLRVAGLQLAADGAATPSEDAPARPAPRVQDDPATRRRIEALRRRTDVDPADAAALARQALAALSALPRETSGARAEPEAALAERIDALEDELAEAEARLARRRTHADALRAVPERLVARLPDPEIVRGIESWVLVRDGRVFAVDREALLETGSRAIQRILPDGTARQVRPDEFEAVARYLRKRSIGLGPFRWQLRTEPEVRVELEWTSRDGGIEASRLERDSGFRRWLAQRSPDRDFIRFHVWSDSFETYLAARELTERAGFRAGWRGYERDEELDLGLRFGAPRTPERAIEVD